MYTEKDIQITAQGVGWKQLSLKDELRIWGTAYEKKTARLQLVLTPDDGDELSLSVVTSAPEKKFLQVANKLFPKQPKPITLEAWGNALHVPHRETGDDLQDAIEKMIAFLHDDIQLGYHHMQSIRAALNLMHSRPEAVTDDYDGMEFQIITED